MPPCAGFSLFGTLKDGVYVNNPQPFQEYFTTRAPACREIFSAGARPSQKLQISTSTHSYEITQTSAGKVRTINTASYVRKLQRGLQPKVKTTHCMYVLHAHICSCRGTSWPVRRTCLNWRTDLLSARHLISTRYYVILSRCLLLAAHCNSNRRPRLRSDQAQFKFHLLHKNISDRQAGRW